MSDHVTLFEVGPRDGLQNEKTLIPTDAKIALIDMLSGSGLKKIEATSFVSPKWVPQLTDAVEVMAGIKRAPGVKYAVLTPNMKGMERAIASKASEVAVFASASEGFSQQNINCSINESFERFAPILEAARANHIPVRGYVSCAVECPYDGKTNPTFVANVAERLIALGCYEVSVADTIGRATPPDVKKMVEAVLSVVPADKIAGHFHDTGGRAIDNIEVSLKQGIRTFDSAVGGLGGCPYAPGAAGNVATETVLDFLNKAGFSTGVDVNAIKCASDFIRMLTISGGHHVNGGLNTQ